MNAENKDDFLHRIATNVGRNLIKRYAAFTLQSVHVRSLQIYEYFMVAIISTIQTDGRTEGRQHIANMNVSSRSLKFWMHYSQYA